MELHAFFLKEAGKTASMNPEPGQTAWECPSNIALVKYWGKDAGQIPMNASVSFTLKASVVRISMAWKPVGEGSGGLSEFSLNGARNAGFQKRIAGYLHSLQPFFPFLSRTAISVKSESTFPHSAGIASSAAAFGALSLCICSMEQQLLQGVPGREYPEVAAKTESGVVNPKNEKPDPGFLEKASFMARLGSGSACRSVHGGFVAWGETPTLAGSGWESGVRLYDRDVDTRFSGLRDAILVVDDGEKAVSSSAGHALMRQHVYRSSRIAQAGANMEKMLMAVRLGDEDMFFRVLENEALALHGLMMTSDPGFVLMKPATLEALQRIRDFREKSGLNLGYTMDAGPNIHLIYFSRDADVVRSFIQQEILPLCAGRRWIDDGIGEGPVPVRPF